MKTTRTYTMDARARSVEQTRTRIMDAALTLAQTHLLPDISLDDVARDAGVSVQTVLRHFGSRAELVETTIDYAVNRVRLEREAPEGDVEAAMDVLVRHYEQRGDTALLMLGQEASDPQVRRITALGRSMHHEWVSAVFAPWLRADATLHDLLVVVTDVYTWKLLRRDRRLSRARTQERMTTLVRAVLGTATNDPRPNHHTKES